MTEPARDSAILIAALRYAARGWPVFPCSPENKRPLIPTAAETREGFYVNVEGERVRIVKGEGGLKLASCDERQIRAWWKRWPLAMIGMPTGEAVGVVVVDLDPRMVPTNGMLTSLQQFCGEGSLPPCPLVRTQSGGLHLWFAYPDMPADEKLGNRAGLFAKIESAKEPIREHVDIRGEGGYVILPPSRMASGNRYEWEQTPFELGDAPFPPLPARLHDVIMKRGEFAPKQKAVARRSAAGAPSTPLSDDERVRKYAANAMLAECAELARTPEGRRHDALNLAAFNLGTLVGSRALSEAVARAAIEDAAHWPGSVFSKKEADTIDDGLRAGMLRPRDLSDIASSRPSRPQKGEAREARPPSSSSSTTSFSPRPPFDEEGPENPRIDEDGESLSPDEGPDGGPLVAEGAGGGDDGWDGGGDFVDDEDPDERERRILACLWLALNDTGNAERLLLHFGDNILHVRNIGWHWWTGTHWELEGGDEHVARYAQQVAVLIGREADMMEMTRAEKIALSDGLLAEQVEEEERGDAEKEAIAAMKDARIALSKRKSARRKFAISCGNTTKIKGMIAQVLPHRTVGPEMLDADPMAMNVMNGTLHFIREEDPEVDTIAVQWRGRVELRPHDRKALITKLAPVTYDPKAKAPNWQASIERFLPREPVRKFVQTYHGFGLTGISSQHLVFYWGKGANWKSTFIEVVCRIMGQYAQMLPVEAVSGEGQRRGDQATPEFARLPGARIVRVSELPEGEKLREAMIKALTGGEPILTRHLHKGFFEFRPVFKPCMSGNHKPKIHGADEGIWRRVNLVTWEVTIPKEERREFTEVVGELMAESSGILNWLLDGLRLYLAEGLVAPDEVRAATDAYRADMDPLGKFIAHCIESADGSRVTAREMYDAYCNWLRANGEKPWSETLFGLRMPERLPRIDARVRYYDNVRLHDVPAAQLPAQAGFGPNWEPEVG